MRSWSVAPPLRALPPSDDSPLRLFDTASGELQSAQPEGIARLYVCGITPYDATHMGHAATYVAFDTLHRVWLDAGLTVAYSQNITDIDDPLLERAARDGVDWKALAESQVQLFRDDMEALRVLPPQSYIGVTEVIPRISAAVETLLERGYAYLVDTPDAESIGAQDVYFDTRRAESEPWRLGDESHLSLPEMLKISAERGGDPERPGKRDKLDPLLWRVARAGEPRWDSALGAGRPGWHIECSVIATDSLGPTITVQGGGSDLIFPHHEFSAGHSAALHGVPFADLYVHTGMVGFGGEKMSKSLGNLVLVSQLRARGIDPRAIRLAILENHYRSDWEWTDTLLRSAMTRLSFWTERARSESADECAAASTIEDVRTSLRRDLDTPAALATLDAWFARERSGSPEVTQAIDALLGIRLEHFVD